MSQNTCFLRLQVTLPPKKRLFLTYFIKIGTTVKENIFKIAEQLKYWLPCAMQSKHVEDAHLTPHFILDEIICC